MNVSLGNKWERFVDAKVKSGDFQTASEVLRELEGISSLDRGQRIEGEQAFERLHQRAKERKACG